MSKHNRHQAVISRNTDEHISEDHWLKQFEKSLEKGAVQPRSPNSLHDQINSIMNGTKSKYTSVQSAVDDMMQRSGLSTYLKTSQENTENTSKIAQANMLDDLLDTVKKHVVAGDWYNAGHAIGKLELAEGQPATNAMDNIMAFKYFHDPVLKATQVPKDRWGDFTLGYCAGRGMSHEQTKAQAHFTQRVMDMSAGKTKKASDQNGSFDKSIPIEKKQQDTETPDVVKQFPGIMTTLENHIKSTRGNLPVPAIIDKLRSIHRADIAKDNMWDDDKLIRLVSKLNLAAKKNNPASYENYNNLAVGDRDTADSDVDPSNTDAFNALMPAKI